MNIVRNIFIISGISIALAILLTLDVTFNHVVQGSIKSAIEKDLEEIFEITVPDFLLNILSVLLYGGIMILGGILGNLSYLIYSKAMHFFTRQETEK